MDDQRSPETAQLTAAIAPQTTELVVRGLLGRLHELDACPLRLPDDDTVDVVTVPEVRAWLEGWRARARAGERL